uniref:Uncharacterized protein n=1 Tax=Glossina brevipalpis TaxID=37001 RepID=A0A1A9WHV9_9MUSC
MSEISKVEDVDRLLEHYCEEFYRVCRLTLEQEGAVNVTMDRGNSKTARDRYTTCKFCGVAASEWELFYSHQCVKFDADCEMVFKEIEDNVPSTSAAANPKNNFVISSNAKVAAKEIYCSVCDFFIPQAKYKIHLRKIRHKERSVDQIHQKLEELNSIKLNLRLFGEYVKEMDTEMVLTLKHFSTNFSAIREVGEVNRKITEISVELTKAAEEYQERDSGWAIAAFKFCELTICKL